MIGKSFEDFAKQAEAKIKVGYVHKIDLGFMQLHPVPHDLHNYIEVPYDSSFDYSDKIYDPVSEQWLLNDEIRIKDIKNEAKTTIYKKYSVEDQNNISFLDVDDPERIEAIAWIKGIRGICKNAIADGVLLKDIDWTVVSNS